MNKRNIKFVCHCVKWFDKINGNTYHSVKIIKTSNGKTITAPYQYGYGEQYKQTALGLMLKHKFIPKRYTDKLYMYERENNYPILWNEVYGLKRQCKANGEI